MKETMDYSSAGGAVLFGLKAPVVKCHGSSDAKDVYKRQVGIVILTLPLLCYLLTQLGRIVKRNTYVDFLLMFLFLFLFDTINFCLLYTSLKHITEAVDTFIGMVGERSMCEEGVP